MESEVNAQNMMTLQILVTNFLNRPSISKYHSYLKLHQYTSYLLKAQKGIENNNYYKYITTGANLQIL